MVHSLSILGEMEVGQAADQVILRLQPGPIFALQVDEWGKSTFTMTTCCKRQKAQHRLCCELGEVFLATNPEVNERPWLTLVCTVCASLCKLIFLRGCQIRAVRCIVFEWKPYPWLVPSPGLSLRKVLFKLPFKYLQVSNNRLFRIEWERSGISQLLRWWKHKNVTFPDSLSPSHCFLQKAFHLVIQRDGVCVAALHRIIHFVQLWKKNQNHEICHFSGPDVIRESGTSPQMVKERNGTLSQCVAERSMQGTLLDKTKRRQCP